MHIYRQLQPLVCPLPNQVEKSTVKPSTTDLMSAAQVEGSAAPWDHGTPDHILNRLATAAVKGQQYPQALALLSQLIEQQPKRAMHYSNRGLVYLWLGDPLAALADCNRAVELEPDLDQAYNNRAMCHTALGNLAAALQDYEYAVDLNPFNSRARINLGATLRQMGDFDRALDCFEEALIFHQLSEFIYAERGRTYHLRGDWNCALADYQRTLAAVADLKHSHQLQNLVQRVQQWVSELLPQQQWA